MKLSVFTIVTVLLMTFAAQARDTRAMYNIEDALTTQDAKSKLSGDIKFYWGKQTAPAIAQELGEFTSNKKTNAFNKSDYLACQHVFLSAVLSLRDRARQQGGNAVINIRSNYKGFMQDSSTQFECGAGALIAGVTLVGKVVKTK